MSKWEVYTGSDEQIAEMKTGFIYRNESGVQSDLILTASNFISPQHLKNHLNNVKTTHILICEPHPYADIIKIWADTGCEICVKLTNDYKFSVSEYENHPTTRLTINSNGVYFITTTPDWSIPGAEYGLHLFKE